VPLPRRRTVIVGGLGALAAGALGVGFVRSSRSIATRVTTITGTLHSTARKSDAGWVTIYPPGIDPYRPVLPTGGRVPVVVALHGYGSSEAILGTLGLDVALGEAVAAGTPPFALAAIAGGNGYWHARTDGTDAGRMVVEEFLPSLASAGLAAGGVYRVGLVGWSMGGYGAIRLAEQLGSGAVAAVAAASPALWLHPGDTPQGAFDDAEDFRRNDVFARRNLLQGMPIRVDCGSSDPFLAATRSFVAGLAPAPSGSFGPGGHDNAYWRRLATAQIQFFGTALAGTTLRPGQAVPTG
jgi:pimeloyl-ACP methyl ester carboxylesterase